MTQTEFIESQCRSLSSELASLLELLENPSHSNRGIEEAIGLLLKTDTPGYAWGGARRCLAEAVSRTIFGKPAQPPTVEEVAIELAWMDVNNLSDIPLALAAATGIPMSARFECAEEILAVIKKWKQSENPYT